MSQRSYELEPAGLSFGACSVPLSLAHGGFKGCILQLPCSLVRHREVRAKHFYSDQSRDHGQDEEQC